MKVIKLSLVGNHAVVGCDGFEGIKEQAFTDLDSIGFVDDSTIALMEVLIEEQITDPMLPLMITYFSDPNTQEGRFCYDRNHFKALISGCNYYRAVRGNLGSRHHYLHFYFYQIDDADIAEYLTSSEENVRSFGKVLKAKIENLEEEKQTKHEMEEFRKSIRMPQDMK